MRSIGLLIYLSFLLSAGFAQQSKKTNQLLITAFPVIEEYYNVKFSFADELILNKRISYDLSRDISKRAFLDDLEKQTGLKFELVNSNFVVIRPFKAEDKVNICGRILNEKEQPLIGATVLLSKTKMMVVTDQSGFFEVEGVEYQESIEFQHLGYKPQKLNVSALLSVDCESFRMKEFVSVLPEVVIEDFLAAGVVQKNQSLEFLLQELKILPGLIEPDVLQSIQQAPGVNSPFETASGIFVRGGSPDLNLVRWNGIKTYSQGHFFGMLSAFNPYITKDVTFIKNGASAKYGDRVSGIIEIKSGDEIVEDISGGAGFNMIYGDAYIDVPIIDDKLSVQLSGTRSYTDFSQTFTYNQFSDRVFQNTKINEGLNDGSQQAENDFFFYDYSTKIIFKPGEKDRFIINTLYNKNDLDFASEDRDLRFNDILNTENEGYDINWRHEGGKVQLDADAYFTRYLLNYEFRSTQNDTIDIASKKNFVKDYGFNINAALQLSTKSRLFTGYQFSKNNVKYAFVNRTPLYQLTLDEDDVTLNTHAVYAEYEFKSDNTRLAAGIRYNNYSELNDHYVEPRLTIEQSLTDALQLKASAEYRSQTVSQIRESVVSDLSLENQVWTLSSEDKFPVIDSYQYGAGFSFKDKSWLIDVEAYAKRIDGITTLTFGFLNPVDSEYRIGDSNIKGVDFFIKKQFGGYKTWLGYSYLFSENEFFGLNDNRPFPGNWNIEHTVKWSHFYDIGSLHLSLGWWWHTGKSFTNVVESPAPSGPVSIRFDGINEANLPVYHRLDLSAVYEFHLNKDKDIRYRVGLSIFNLYDRKNLLNREFRTTPSLDNELIDTRVFSLGFTPNLVFRVFW